MAGWRSVRQQEPIEPPETGATPQQLALRALSTIHQYPIATCLDEKAGMVAFCRRNAR
jgi:hypothetical protein